MQLKLAIPVYKCRTSPLRAALKTREWKRRHQVAGVENAGGSGVRRRNEIPWTTNASRRAWHDVTT